MVNPNTNKNAISIILHSHYKHQPRGSLKGYRIDKWPDLKSLYFLMKYLDRKVLHKSDKYDNYTLFYIRAIAALPNDLRDELEEIFKEGFVDEHELKI